MCQLNCRVQSGHPSCCYFQERLQFLKIVSFFSVEIRRWVTIPSHIRIKIYSCFKTCINIVCDRLHREYVSLNAWITSIGITIEQRKGLNWLKYNKIVTNALIGYVLYKLNTIKCAVNKNRLNNDKPIYWLINSIFGAW